MRMVGGRSSFWARLVNTDSSSRMMSRSTSVGAVAASMAAAGSSTKRQAFAGDLLIHRASWSPQCLSACSSCSDSLIGGKCAKEHLSSDSWMLRPGQSATQNRKIYGFLAGSCPPYKTQHFVTGLRQSLQGFQNTGGQVRVCMDRTKKLRPEPNGKEVGPGENRRRYYESFKNDVGWSGTDYRRFGFGIGTDGSTECGIPRP